MQEYLVRALSPTTQDPSADSLSTRIKSTFRMAKGAPETQL